MQFAPLWPAFMARHPRLVLDVTLGDRLVDLAVRIAHLPSSSLVSRRLAVTRSAGTRPAWRRFSTRA
ncbi:hypothetical protein [Sphaerotilus sp.]|uniref:hypothetical protein n=1 Tax=Sphaerotilus sp. TaxID=2093942 RepID=UPI0034E1C953